MDIFRFLSLSPASATLISQRFSANSARQRLKILILAAYLATQVPPPQTHGETNLVRFTERRALGRWLSQDLESWLIQHFFPNSFIEIKQFKQMKGTLWYEGRQLSSSVNLQKALLLVSLSFLSYCIAIFCCVSPSDPQRSLCSNVLFTSVSTPEQLML